MLHTSGVVRVGRPRTAETGGAVQLCVLLDSAIGLQQQLSAAQRVLTRHRRLPLGARSAAFAGLMLRPLFLLVLLWSFSCQSAERLNTVFEVAHVRR